MNIPKSEFGGQTANEILAGAGLRATRQRLALAEILFLQETGHVSAECLYEEVQRRGAPGSLSRVYGSLKVFCEAGLLRRVPVYGNIAWYELDDAAHHHFYLEQEDRLVDISADLIPIDRLPPPPHGYEHSGVDVLCRVRKTSGDKT